MTPLNAFEKFMLYQITLARWWAKGPRGLAMIRTLMDNQRKALVGYLIDKADGGRMTYKLIGFTGRKGSGKNTAADMTGGVQFAFAAELKKTARDWYGLSWEQVHDAECKEVVDERWGLTPRQIMQRLGTEVARSIHTETWTRLLLDQRIPTGMAANPYPPRLAVITDVRFPNEVSAIKAAGGSVIRIERPGLAVGPYSDHPSETAIDTLEVDGVIVNDGSREALPFKVLGLLTTLGVYRG